MSGIAHLRGYIAAIALVVLIVIGATATAG